MRHKVNPMNQSMRLMIISVLIASANAFTSISSSTTTTRCHSTLFYRDDDYQIDHPIKRSDFKQRMKNIVKKQKRTAWRPDNMRTADTLQEYANAIEEARRMDRIVVVNFHATWCKKCHSLRPAFHKMAIRNPNTIYLDVPVSESNANLQKGLGIESVPFCHVYHPEKGLVEETKISRDTLSDFVRLVQRHDTH